MKVFCIWAYLGWRWRFEGKAMEKHLAEIVQGCDLSDVSPMAASAKLINGLVFVQDGLSNGCLPDTWYAEDS